MDEETGEALKAKYCKEGKLFQNIDSFFLTALLMDRSVDSGFKQTFRSLLPTISALCELIIQDAESWVIQVNFELRSHCGRLNYDGNTGVSFCLRPHHIPECSVVCSLLPKVKLQQLQDQLQEKARSLQGQPKIMELCCLAEELLSKEVDALVNLRSTASNMFYPCLQSDANVLTAIYWVKLWHRAILFNT